MTDTYTKMLRAKGAEDIQKEHEWKIGDKTDKGVIVMLYPESGKPNYTVLTSEATWLINDLLWLPSIEDLLGMVEPIFCRIVPTLSEALDELYGAFYSFCFDNKTIEQWPYGHKVSNQELWLAFIQHELKGLEWNGEEWV